MRFIRKALDNTVALTGLVSATIGLLLAFGVHMTDVQVGAIMAFLGALLLFLNSTVMVKRKVITRVTNAGRVVAGEASSQKTDSTVAVLPDPHTGAPTPLAPVRPELVA